MSSTHLNRTAALQTAGYMVSKNSMLALQVLYIFMRVAARDNLNGSALALSTRAKKTASAPSTVDRNLCRA